MKVWIVMGNDFPNSVFATEEAAESFVADKESAERLPEPGRVFRRIYWRSYEFEVREK